MTVTSHSTACHIERDGLWLLPNWDALGDCLGLWSLEDFDFVGIKPSQVQHCLLRGGDVG